MGYDKAREVSPILYKVVGDKELEIWWVEDAESWRTWMWAVEMGTGRRGCLLKFPPPRPSPSQERPSAPATQRSDKARARV